MSHSRSTVISQVSRRDSHRYLIEILTGISSRFSQCISRFLSTLNFCFRSATGRSGQSTVGHGQSRSSRSSQSAFQKLARSFPEARSEGEAVYRSLQELLRFGALLLAFLHPCPSYESRPFHPSAAAAQWKWNVRPGRHWVTDQNGEHSPSCPIKEPPLAQPVAVRRHFISTFYKGS